MTGVQRLQSRFGNMSIDLGGRQISMAQQHLHAAKIGPVVQEVRRKRMTQRMRGEGRIDSGSCAVSLNQLPERLSRHRLTSPCQKYRTAFLLTEQ